MKKDLLVISLGGSLIAPEQIDVKFLRRFKNLILSYLKKGKKFIIICGGGRTARAYQEAARAVSKLNAEDADWLGIHGTRINAHLLRTIFKEQAEPQVIKNPRKKINFKKDIIIAAGWQPGCSTDYDAVLLAKNFGAKKIINLSNVDYVYDKDPRKFKQAKPLKNINWKNFIKLLPPRWSPGLNSPFDPLASRLAAKLGLEVAIINGRKLNNLKNYLADKTFIGTRIK